MHFSLKNKPKNIFENRSVYLFLLVLVIIVLSIVYIYMGMAGVYAMLFVIISTTIAVLIKESRKRGFGEFDTSDDGVIVNGNLYQWAKFKYYSFYGDKQSERIGIIGLSRLGYDPINPYRFAKMQILRLHMGFRKSLNLQIDSDQVQNLVSIIEQKGIKRISLLRKIIGY